MCLKCKGEGKRIKKLKQIVKKFPEMTSLTEVAIQSNLLSYSQRSPRSPHSYSYKKENRRMPFKSLNNLSLRRVLELQLDPSMLPLALMEEMSGRSNCKGCEHWTWQVGNGGHNISRQIIRSTLAFSILLQHLIVFMEVIANLVWWWRWWHNSWNFFKLWIFFWFGRNFLQSFPIFCMFLRIFGTHFGANFPS